MSVKTETGTITLGDRTFDVRAFTFDQLQILLPLFDRLNLKEPVADVRKVEPNTIETCREIIRAAIADQIEPEGLTTLKTNLVEMFSAVAIIAKTSGLVEVGELVRGMAKPVAS